MILIKQGDKGTLVGMIQEKLSITKTNIFDENTKNKVIEFQRKKGLKIDGEVGRETFSALGIENPSEYLSTDIRNVQDNNSVMINKFYLDSDEYKKGSFEKFYLFLHHTAGGHDPYAVVKMWNNDTRGAIATQYVIGNKSTSGNETMDGVIVEAFPDNAWAYHLGDNGSNLLHPHSVGIEICSYGPLTKGGFKSNGKFINKDPNKFYNYVGTEMPSDQVCDLGYEFKGYRYYHKYSDKQIKALEMLIDSEIKKIYPKIDLSKGLNEWLKTEHPSKAFDFKQDAYLGKIKGVLSHTSTRKDKTDVYPDPRLIELLKKYA